ncbi:MAG TPA: protease complex subunit PrcB family protein [Gammaproteobacteria bacterium]|nr:protease complex subunit PrcB family protein [Gammaproteobacteria bacterium]
MKPLLLAMLALLGAACSLPPAEELPVPFTTVAMGEQSGIHQPKNVVVRTADEWARLWKLHDAGKRPSIDFGRDMVIAVFLGQRPTAGYRVRIMDVRQGPDQLQVHVRERKPDSNAVLAQVLTYPYVMIRLPKKDLPVTFAFRD